MLRVNVHELTAPVRLSLCTLAAALAVVACGSGSNPKAAARHDRFGDPLISKATQRAIRVGTPARVVFRLLGGKPDDPNRDRRGRRTCYAYSAYQSHGLNSDSRGGTQRWSICIRNGQTQITSKTQMKSVNFGADY